MLHRIANLAYELGRRYGYVLAAWRHGVARGTEQSGREFR